MKTITQLKAAATLHKKVSYDEGIMTRMEWVDLMKSRGHFVRECLAPAVKYNRIKYNRMDYEEQKAYDKRLTETKIEYRLYVTDTSSFSITKAEYDYFNVQR